MKPEDLSQQYSKDNQNGYTNPHYLITGIAGTGKTTKALQLAKQHKNIHVIRNTVGVRDVGYLKGTLAQKIAPFFDLYKPLLEELNIPKTRVSFGITTHLRGVTFEDTFVIVDEAQNLTYKELFTVLTRIGRGSTLCIVGDENQCDLPEGPGGYLKFITVYELLAKKIVMKKQYRNDLISQYLDAYRKIFTNSRLNGKKVLKTAVSDEKQELEYLYNCTD